MMLYGPHVRDLLQARLKQLKINLSFNFLHPLLLLLLFLPKKSPSISLPLDENAVEGKESQFKIERPDCPSFPLHYRIIPSWMVDLIPFNGVGINYDTAANRIPKHNPPLWCP